MNNVFDDIFNINPKCSTTIAFILGLVLIDHLNTPEQNVLGNWIILIGQTILTNASSQNIIESRINGNTININSKEVRALYDPIFYDINKIKEIIKKVYPDANEEIDILMRGLKDLESKIKKISQE